MEAVQCARRGALRRERMSSGGASLSAVQFVLLFFAVALAAMATPSAAALYNVGDSAGWTSTGNVNYTAWTSSKTFHVGDIIVFEYNPQSDNVLEVVREDYHNCSILSPLANFSTGHDSFLLRRTGHRFFLSGFAGHCAAGQKVDIRIPKLHHAAAPAKPPSHAPFSSSSATPNRAAHTEENPGTVQQVNDGGAAGQSGEELATALALLGFVAATNVMMMG